MSDEIIVHFCAPTLAGIKPGSLFTYIYEADEDIIDSLRRVNRRLAGKGLRMIPMKLRIDAGCGRKKCLLYLYRPEFLEQTLQSSPCMQILQEEGYRKASAAGYISVLREHLKNGEEFPHEIGLFLGYPAEDVKGFIQNRGANYKLCGTWKVYGDVAVAKKQFNQYQRCTDIYSRLVQQGAVMEQLAVKTR